MVAVKNISELLPDEPIPPPLDEEIIFNNAVREYTLLGVLVLVLVAVSHVLLARFRRRDPAGHSTSRRLRSPALPPPDDEATVDTIAMWVCTLSLSISLGAVLLLPLSILSNELLATYRDSRYVRWINRSFIQSLWNMVFLFSNLSLFVALPFAYLFTEAEGFSGSKKGMRSRVVEAAVVLLLLVVLVLGVAFILALLLGYAQHNTLRQTIDVWGSFYLPFLYSLISCLGVLFLLLCTPVGLGRLFSALKGLIRGGTARGGRVGDVGMAGGGFLRSAVVEDLHAATMEEQALARQLKGLRPVDARAESFEDLYLEQQQPPSTTSPSSSGLHEYQQQSAVGAPQCTPSSALHRQSPSRRKRIRQSSGRRRASHNTGTGKPSGESVLRSDVPVLVSRLDAVGGAADLHELHSFGGASLNTSSQNHESSSSSSVAETPNSPSFSPGWPTPSVSSPINFCGDCSPPSSSTCSLSSSPSTSLHFPSSFPLSSSLYSDHLTKHVHQSSAFSVHLLHNKASVAFFTKTGESLGYQQNGVAPLPARRYLESRFEASPLHMAKAVVLSEFSFSRARSQEPSASESHAGEFDLRKPAAPQVKSQSQLIRPQQLPRPLRKSLPSDLGDFSLVSAEAGYLRTLSADQRRDLWERWQSAYAARKHLERVSQQGLLRRCLLYPLGVVVLVMVTAVVVALVVLNTLQLVSGFKALPLVTAAVSTAGGGSTATEDGTVMLGKRAVLVWVLGPLGAVVEVILILYLMAASLVGCYSLPLMKKMKPVYGDTPMVQLIGNCGLLLVLASALPLLATTLGLTNFDLLGDYGRVGWLGHFWIVLAYNALFVSAAVWCLVHQFTAAVRGEIIERLSVLGEALLRQCRASHPLEVRSHGTEEHRSSPGSVLRSTLRNALHRASLVATGQNRVVNKRK